MWIPDSLTWVDDDDEHDESDDDDGDHPDGVRQNKDVPLFLEALETLGHPDYHLIGRCISHVL